MRQFEYEGDAIRSNAKALVLRFMQAAPECKPDANGKRQQEILRDCGLDWGDKKGAASNNQASWIAALLRELEEEEQIQRVPDKYNWRRRSAK